jgi:hypothetical protein
MKRSLLVVVALLVAAPSFAQQQERILLPLFTGPVHGAYGSEFHTDLRAVNTGPDPVSINGLTVNCETCLPPANVPYVLAPGEELMPSDVLLSGSPGRFLYVANTEVGSLAMNLRVYDITHDALNFGTEMPIVRESEFSINKIELIGVPTDPRFRNTLRIYSTFQSEAIVTIGDRASVRIPLTGGTTQYDAAYAQYSDFPTGGAPVRVTIEVDPGFVSLLPVEIPVWAFITVTNNETQAIATITPQP